MKIIKISIPLPTNLLLRQSPGMSDIWGDCKFLINTEVEKCDWWFVLHGSGLTHTEESVCDPNHIVYVSMEPNEIISSASSKFILASFFFSYFFMFLINILNINFSF